MRTAAILLSLLCASVVFCQAPDSLWSHYYGGGGEEWCQAMQQTSDGGYVLAGHTFSFGPAMENFWLVKTDVLGNTVWSRAYGGANAERCWAVRQTSDGGYILAGVTQSFGAGAKDFWLVKTNANGDSLWSRTFGGSLNEWATCVEQTDDGGYVLAGWTQSYGAGDFDMWVVKTNSLGILQWSHTYGGAALDECHDIQELPGGGYIVAGFTYSFGAGQEDFYLVRAMPNGDVIWSRTYGGSNPERCWAACRMSDGGFALTGTTMSYGAGAKDFWLVRTDELGNLVWSHPYGGASNEWATSVQETSDGGVLLAGWTQSFGAGNLDMWAVKTYPDGNVYWSRPFGGSGFDECQAAQETSDGGYAFGGFSSSFGGGGYNFWLVKTGADEPLPVELVSFHATPQDQSIRLDFATASELDNDHFEIWRAIDPDGEFARTVELPSQGNSATEQRYVYVDREVEVERTYWYFLADVDINGQRTEHRNLVVSATVAGSVLPNDYSLCAFPNPFNPSTMLRFTLRESGPVKMRIFDVEGREVFEFAERYYESGSHEMRFSADHLPTGLYLAQLEAGGIRLVQKLLLIK